MSKQQNMKSDVEDPDALRVLNPEFKELRSLIENLRQRAQLLDLKAAVLGGAYVIFQAIMYGQVNPSSAAPPWFPACLSGSISLAFWPAFAETVNDCMRTRQQRESSFVEQDIVYRKICSVQSSSRRHDGGDASQRSLNKAFASVRRQRHAYVLVLYFGLLLLTLCVPCVTLNQARVFRSRVITYSL